MFCFAVLDPPAPEAVSVIVYCLLRAKLWVTVTPLPDVASPKLHEYVDALVVALALNVQVLPEQLVVKLADGTGAGGGVVVPPFMKPE